MCSRKKRIFKICPCSFGEQEKQAKDNNTKGVVGQIGRNTPIPPNVKNMNPAPIRSEFLILLTFKIKLSQTLFQFDKSTVFLINMLTVSFSQYH